MPSLFVELRHWSIQLDAVISYACSENGDVDFSGDPEMMADALEALAELSKIERKLKRLVKQRAESD